MNLHIQDLRRRSYERLAAKRKRMPVMQYLTDGTHLYEVASRRTVRNYGLLRGTISYTIIRDCVTERTATIGALHLAALSIIR